MFPRLIHTLHPSPPPGRDTPIYLVHPRPSWLLLGNTTPHVSTCWLLDFDPKSVPVLVSKFVTTSLPYVTSLTPQPRREVKRRDDTDLEHTPSISVQSTHGACLCSCSHCYCSLIYIRVAHALLPDQPLLLYISFFNSSLILKSFTASRPSFSDTRALHTHSHNLTPPLPDHRLSLLGLSLVIHIPDLT